MTLAPFPWFGGKSRAAPIAWAAMGADVPGYIEPFAGSLAVLLGRPSLGHGPETVNDADGLLSNFWRAVRADPDAVAAAADWPVNEVDLSARHLRLVSQRAALTERLQVDADFYDAKLAGWWVWGACAWIGSGWCSGEGPWSTDGERWIDRRQLPHLGDEGMGINRQLPHLGDEGMGINRKLPHLGDEGRGAVVAWMRALAARLRGVRVACGDWERVTTYSVQRAGGFPCAILLDPPYPEGEMAYSAGCDGVDVWHAARRWAIDNGNDRQLRIVFCGYEGGEAMPSGWRSVSWAQRKGYASTDDALDNAARETLWLSPGCLAVGADTGRQLPMFGASP